MTYEESNDFLNSIPKFNPEITMEDRVRFYEQLGQPCVNQRVVHVAGTNGKGSVCSFLRCSLEDAGYHTATFISPHLVDVRERFLIDGEPVGEASYLQAFTYVAERMKEVPLSYFDLLFFVFILLPEVQKADVIILETGLGGTYDATNIMPRKNLCIITQIGLDHMAQLGNTIAEIASEKAGILRENTPVIYRGYGEEAPVIRSRAQMRGISEKQCYPVERSHISDINVQDKKIDFFAHSVYHNSVLLSLHTSAVYQTENALLALRGLDVLAMQGMQIPVEAIQSGFARMHWQARMEEVLPGVFIDGAHNEDGVSALVTSLRSLREFRRGQATLLFAVMSDKNYEKMLPKLCAEDLFDHIVFTGIGTGRCAGAEELHALYPEIPYMDTPEEAFDLLRSQLGDEDILVVAGSLYLAGRILKYIRG